MRTNTARAAATAATRQQLASNFSVAVCRAFLTNELCASCAPLPRLVQRMFQDPVMDLDLDMVQEQDQDIFF